MTTDLSRLVAVLRERWAPRPGESVPDQRARLESAAARMPLAPGVTPKPVRIGASTAQPLAGEWLEPVGAQESAVLHLHGGGYTIGSLTTIRPLASCVARAAGAKVLTVEYRLAPEHPHPAALDDAVSAYEWLLEQGWAPERVALAGDWAGGGVAGAALVAFRDRGLPRPAAGVCLSPWADLALTGASWAANEGNDPLVTRWLLAEMADHYLAGADPRLPTASPLYADLTGLPPLLIQAGTGEALFDDSSSLARAAGAAGVAVTFESWPDMIHVWHAFAPMLAEANAAITRIGAWLNDRWTATARV